MISRKPMMCRKEAAELISFTHGERTAYMKAVMLVLFIFGSSFSEGDQWVALIMNKRKGIFLFFILQANTGFLTSPIGKRLLGLCNYHKGKTALFNCIFLGPFKPHVYGPHGQANESPLSGLYL